MKKIWRFELSLKKYPIEIALAINSNSDNNLFTQKIPLR